MAAMTLRELAKRLSDPTFTLDTPVKIEIGGEEHDIGAVMIRSGAGGLRALIVPVDVWQAPKATFRVSS